MAEATDCPSSCVHEGVMASYALVTSCSSLPPTSLIQEIMEESLPEARHVLEDIYAYRYRIDNKYYTADIEFCSMQQRTIGDESFADSVQAIIIYFDAGDSVSFDKVCMWNDYLVHWSPEVRLLVCDKCVDDDGHKLSRAKILTWCVENEFELVEYEDPEYEADENPKLEGLKRIRSALSAHTWPNLEMKVSESKVEAGLNDLSLHEVEKKHTEDKSEERTEKEKQNIRDKIDGLFDDDDMALFQAVGKEDPGGESFEVLFHKMRGLKEKAETITDDEERRAYAEKVAVMFWKAIGGDEDEIEGIADSE